VRVREAAATDAPAIAMLLGQLGYPSAADAIPARLAGLAGERRTLALVAEHEGTVVGLITAHFVAAIHADEPLALLTALVVHDGTRGHGVGRALVGRAELWARTLGALRLSVLTATHRQEAHRFYEHLGYVKTGVRFTKTLTG